MIHKLIRFYYDNKSKVWKIILFIAFIILLIQFINYIIKINNQLKINNVNSNTSVINTNNNTINDIGQSTEIKSNKSLTSGEQIEESKIKEVGAIIEKFINACNENDTETAYSLLSQQCKNQMYPTVKDFQEKYLNYLFKGNIKKTATIENWSDNIYKVNLKEDIMATGNSNSKSNQDYITIVSENGENKLNVNSFVRTETIDKTNTQNNIEIKIIEKNVYMDYEEYNISIINNSENIILLDPLKSTKSIFIKDNNNVKYYAYTNEILESFLKVESGKRSQLSIKFARSYSETRTIQEMSFSNLIFNYDKYLTGDLTSDIFTINL